MFFRDNELPRKWRRFEEVGMTSKVRWIIWGLPILMLIGMAAFATAKPFKLSGKLYMHSLTTTLTSKAGAKCSPSETMFCFQNARCTDGQVARGFNFNVVNEGQDKQHLGGIGLTCADPNEIVKTTKIGDTGKDYSGTEIRDACSPGTFLTGAVFFTDDRTVPIGLSKICRKWPTNQVFDDARKFGAGAIPRELLCDPGRFVTGIKFSYERVPNNAGGFNTRVMNVAMYCTEMREYMIEPDESEKTPDR